FGSMLPSMNSYSYFPSNTAPKASSDTGIRMARPEQIRGLMRRTDFLSMNGPLKQDDVNRIIKRNVHPLPEILPCPQQRPRARPADLGPHAAQPLQLQVRDVRHLEGQCRQAGDHSSGPDATPRRLSTDGREMDCALRR